MEPGCIARAGQLLSNFYTSRFTSVSLAVGISPRLKVRVVQGKTVRAHKRAAYLLRGGIRQSSRGWKADSRQQKTAIGTPGSLKILTTPPHLHGQPFYRVLFRSELLEHTVGLQYICVLI